MQERHSETGDRTIVDRFDWELRDAAKVVFAKKALVDETLETDEERIPGAGGKALKGLVGIACGIQGKDLPEFLSGRVQEVDEPVCLGTEVADTVGPG